MTRSLTFQQALEAYYKAFGEAAMQPSRALSTQSPNGTWHLRNVRGYLGAVTGSGKFMPLPGVVAAEREVRS